MCELDTILRLAVALSMVCRKVCTWTTALSAYSTVMGNICRSHEISNHFYADDIQLYLTVNDNKDLNVKMAATEKCSINVRAWMTADVLKLNLFETELILFHSNRPPPLCPVHYGLLSVRTVPPGPSKIMMKNDFRWPWFHHI